MKGDLHVIAHDFGARIDLLGKLGLENYLQSQMGEPQ